MEKPDWVLWGDGRKIVTLEQCVCLSLDAEPTEIFTPRPEAVQTKTAADRPAHSAAPVVASSWMPSRQQQNEQLAFTHEALLSTEGVKRLAKLRQHFNEGQPLLQPLGQYRQDEKRVVLYDFAVWAHAMKWEVPEPLQIPPTPAPVTTTPALVVADGKKWTPEKLAELKAYREANTMKATAEKFGITEQRIRQLLPRDEPKTKTFAGMIHRI